ncbi:MAG TPA: glycosyltransferase family 2 protein [Verrucomicrobiae bacterium]|nr:glycosyltransferase family 2 protein [Verrucomicrobiae bacterium]
MATTAPIVLLAFNRPALTARVWERIRAARPTVVLAVADGPRPGHQGDEEKCREVRRIVEQGVDWECRLLTNFAPANLGLRARVSSGLSWAFSEVEQAIILEDDCVPDLTFFRYGTELLARYAAEERVGVITGDNFQPPTFACEASYYFSRYPHCWGWASWRRAWQCYDDSMALWPKLKTENWLATIFSNPGEARYWEEIFDRTHSRQANSWAYAWLFACWANRLLTATPEKNLVANIGAGADATHFLAHDPLVNDKSVHALAFPLRHPATLELNAAADAYTQAHIFGEAAPPPRPSLARRLRHLFGAP